MKNDNTSPFTVYCTVFSPSTLKSLLNSDTVNLHRNILTICRENSLAIISKRRRRFVELLEEMSHENVKTELAHVQGSYGVPIRVASHYSFVLKSETLKHL